jgi:signal transduction histidine kinase
MAQGGKLHVKACANRAKRRVEIRIADDGIGIAREMTDRGPRPFATTKHGGLGLGLALSRRVIERSGGTLELTSAEGQGTVAIIRLPASS